ncbi:hypothetical protein Hanom_Chr06g00575871 [Helianthus anomalus]
MDIGENEAEKDRRSMELERECLEVYRRKVDEAACGTRGKPTAILIYHFTPLCLLVKFRDEISFKLGMM